MVAFDANVLSIAIYDDAGIPIDYRTGKPIHRARDRVEALIDGLNADNDCVLLPAPALGEALTSVAEHIEQYIDQIEQSSSFKIHPFGKREAIEIAIRTKAAKLAGDKREGIEEPWQKVKYDRQILASAKVGGASVIYSTDKHIHEHGKLWGIRVVHLADLPLAESAAHQDELYEEDIEALQKDEQAKADMTGLQRQPVSNVLKPLNGKESDHTSPDPEKPHEISNKADPNPT
jgi:predicted nucleic acid-binding protein